MNTAILLYTLMLFQPEVLYPTPEPSERILGYEPGEFFLIILVAVMVSILFFVTYKVKQKSKEPLPAKFNPAPIIVSEPVPQPPVEENLTTPAIFITYRREDSIDVTGRIYDRLTRHFGKEAVFKDVDSIPLGVDFRKHLGDSVGQCDVLLTVIGKQWLTGERGQRRIDDVRDFVRIEMEAALKRDIPVVPVLVQGSVMPSHEDLPETLQALVYRNGIPVRPDPDFHQDMDRLIKGIEGYLKKKNES